jgi:hypothetical protein
LFTGTSYGLDESIGAVKTLYNRGVGSLGVTFLYIYLTSLFALGFMYVTKKHLAGSKDPVLVALLITVCFVGVYGIVGMTGTITFKNALLGGSLFNNISGLLLLYLILKWTISSGPDLLTFKRMFFSLCTVMAIYGLVRFAAFGGDPANVYENHAGSTVRLTFFDIGQSTLFCITIAYIYLRDKYLSELSCIDIIVGLLCAANIILSFRREAWVGIFLVFLWFFLTSGIKRKVILAVALCLGLLVVIGTYQYRFASKGTGERGPAAYADLIDVKGNLSIAKSARFGPLYKEFIFVANVSPLLGLGPWAYNKELENPFSDIKITFGHCSYLHMFIKTGWIGVALWAGMLLIYVVWWLKRRQSNWNDLRNKALAESFFCGFIFWIPDSIIACPIMVYRHLQILAMLLAIPFIAHILDKTDVESR